MVKYFALLLILSTSLLISGEFTASVSYNQVNLGEGFTLNLTLKDATAKRAPSFDSLKTDFLINSQQQSSNAIINNSQISMSTSWKMTLIPLKEGETTIPSITVDTTEGPLSTEPIKIQVFKGNAPVADPNSVPDILVATELSKQKPYKNEPVLCTIRLTTKKNLANIKLENFKIEDAIVEANGEPKVYEKIVDGKNIGIVEFSYLITPLKAGSIKIPSTVVQGGVQVRRNNASFFDDDPFSMGFDRLKPFALSTQEIVLEVQPPVSGINPWLPAKSLKIEETGAEPKTFQAGEPFTRSFIIAAEGVQSNQLPSLKDQLNDPAFKVYADKPELWDEVKDGKVKSYRKEQYTFIPQKAGERSVPEISVAWWDVTKNEKVISKIQSKKLDILPNQEIVMQNTVSPIEEPQAKGESHVVTVQRDPILYSLVAILVIVLIGAIFWGILLQRKLIMLTQEPERVVVRENFSVKKKTRKLTDLNPT